MITIFGDILFIYEYQKDKYSNNKKAIVYDMVCSINIRKII